MVLAAPESRVAESITKLNEIISKLPHENCCWDVPGSCDGSCDCHVEGIREAWRNVLSYVTDKLAHPEK